MSVFDHLAKDEPQSHNRLLAHVAIADYERLRAHLKPISLHEQAVLYVPHRPIESIYFLDSGVASMVVTMASGKTAEVGTVGNEGFIGLPVLFGAETAEIGAYMQVAGTGLRMPAAFLRQEFDRSQSLRASLLRYAGAFFDQVAQSAACAYHHPLESRCCRWLAMTRDRMPSDRFVLTQEFLAMMLGVRRSSVSAVMGELQRKGLVRYSRGRVNILDRKALQGTACECYHVTKAQFDRLFGDTARHPLESRCCRWLAMTRDRMPSDRFVLTQEFLAMMLGVRRSSVSAVMGELQRKGLVRYSRGRVNILDRKALQGTACECYHVTKAQFDRLFGDTA